MERILLKDPPRINQTRLYFSYLRTYRKTGRSLIIQLNEVANQKHQEEKELEEKKKIASNIKKKELISLKAEKVKKGYDYDEDEDSYSDEDD